MSMKRFSLQRRQIAQARDFSQVERVTGVREDQACTMILMSHILPIRQSYSEHLPSWPNVSYCWLLKLSKGANAHSGLRYCRIRRQRLWKRNSPSNTLTTCLQHSSSPTYPPTLYAQSFRPFAKSSIIFPCLSMRYTRPSSYHRENSAPSLPSSRMRPHLSRPEHALSVLFQAHDAFKRSAKGHQI